VFCNKSCNARVCEELYRLPTAVFGNKIKYIYFRQNERLASLCYVVIATYRSLNATVAQPKNCLFGVSNTTELKNVATKYDNTTCNTETLFSCLCAMCHATRQVFDTYRYATDNLKNLSRLLHPHATDLTRMLPMTVKSYYF